MKSDPIAEYETLQRLRGLLAEQRVRAATEGTYSVYAVRYLNKLEGAVELQRLAWLTAMGILQFSAN